MNAAETSASSAMADCTPLAVVSRSVTTAEIDTFIKDVSTTRTNMAAASRIIRRRLPGPRVHCLRLVGYSWRPFDFWCSARRVETTLSISRTVTRVAAR